MSWLSAGLPKVIGVPPSSFSVRSSRPGTCAPSAWPPPGSIGGGPDEGGGGGVSTRGPPATCDGGGGGVSTRGGGGGDAFEDGGGGTRGAGLAAFGAGRSCCFVAR